MYVLFILYIKHNGSFSWFIITTGISVYIHRKFGSKLLLDVLSKVGLCAPYSEALRYQASSLAITTCVPEESFCQYVFDNADFNVNTIDGRNTFHQMGGIQCVTPNSVILPSPDFPRVKKLSDNEAYLSAKKINIQRWETLGTNSPCIIQNLDLVKPDYCDEGRTMPTPPTLQWMLLSSKKNNIPSWSGYMCQANISKP